MADPDQDAAIGICDALTWKPGSPPEPSGYSLETDNNQLNTPYEAYIFDAQGIQMGSMTISRKASVVTLSAHSSMGTLAIHESRIGTEDTKQKRQGWIPVVSGSDLSYVFVKRGWRTDQPMYFSLNLLGADGSVTHVGQFDQFMPPPTSGFYGNEVLVFTPDTVADPLPGETSPQSHFVFELGI